MSSKHSFAYVQQVHIDGCVKKRCCLLGATILVVRIVVCASRCLYGRQGVAVIEQLLNLQLQK